MKQFRVHAEVITYCHIDVWAENSVKAIRIASDLDGGDFITDDDSGDFNITETEEI